MKKLFLVLFLFINTVTFGQILTITDTGAGTYTINGTSSGHILIASEVDENTVRIKNTTLNSSNDYKTTSAFTDFVIGGANPSDVEDAILKINTITNTINFGDSVMKLSSNDIGLDAWGRPKTTSDYSILHGMFTFNVPITTWKETINGTEALPTNSTSVNGKLNMTSGATLNDDTILDTYRNPRYQPNRGHLYSTSVFLPDPENSGIRRFGFFTEESGTFFELRNDSLFAVVRTTINAVVENDEHFIDASQIGIDLSKGNVYDIQMQWRGVGNYKFFINLKEVKKINYLGTRTELTMFNPANPIAFQCINKGDEVIIQCGCVDVTSEGGDTNGKTYGSIQVENESGQVSVTGFNQPVLVVRNKKIVGGQRNTRDVLALLASAYSDQKSMLRIWSTRDITAITLNDQVWKDYGDGHLEYIVYNTPAVTTPMTFDIAKATPAIFGSRVGQDESYGTSALFEGRTDIYMTPNDIFIFTVHRENGGTALVGVTFEFAEEI